MLCARRGASSGQKLELRETEELKFSTCCKSNNILCSPTALAFMMTSRGHRSTRRILASVEFLSSVCRKQPRINNLLKYV